MYFLSTGLASLSTCSKRTASEHNSKNNTYVLPNMIHITIASKRWVSGTSHTQGTICISKDFAKNDFAKTVNPKFSYFQQRKF